MMPGSEQAAQNKVVKEANMQAAESTMAAQRSAGDLKKIALCDEDERM